MFSLNDVLNGIETMEISQGIHSVLEQSQQVSVYDTKVRAYDTIIGNRFYNRLVWGNWPSQYRLFCERSLLIKQGSPLLDAGCGSLVFTAKAYAESGKRPIVLLDRSLGMLIRAKERLIRLCGSVPNNIKLIQGDIFDLPFKDNIFGSVMSHGLLQMFDDKPALINELERVKTNDGSLSISSLVANNWLGQNALSFLHKSGEVAQVQSSHSLRNIINGISPTYIMQSRGNMAYISNYGN